MATRRVRKYRTSAQTQANFSEIGVTGLNEMSGTLREEFLAELRGKNGIRVYKEMRDNDPIVGSILFAVGMLIRQASWRMKPASEDAAAVETAEFVNSCRLDMTITWGDLMSEVLTMLPFGWSWMETVYKKRTGPQRNESDSSRYSDGRIGWRKMAPRSQDTLNKWVFDDTGGVQAMEQRSPSGTIAVIPISKSLLFRTESNKDSPEGRSVLRNAYRPWYFKKRIEEIEGIGVERDLAGLPVIQPPEGLDLWDPNNTAAGAYRDQAETMVRNIRRDEQEGVLLPFGWTLTLLSTGGKRNFDTSAIIDRYNNSIAMTILADFIILGHNNRYGSFALSSSKTHMFGLAIGGWLDAIADVFNRYAIPRLISVNGINPELTPTLEHGDVEVPDLVELGDYLVKLKNTGMTMFPSEPLERHLLSLAKIPLEGVELGREAPTPEPTGAFGHPPAGKDEAGATPNRGPEKPEERKETRKEDDDDDDEDDA
jgi:hypothetical protein